MNAFEYAVNKTLGLEGGYSNVADDPETNFGITIDDFNEALRRGIISGITDIKDLSIEQAKTIFRIVYWMEMRLGELSDPDVAAEVFDTAVNMGKSAAAVIAQKACNYLGEQLTEDGVMGLETLGTLNRWIAKDRRALFICLNGFQFMRYAAIVSKKAGKKKFARGWTKRIQQYAEVTP